MIKNLKGWYISNQSSNLSNFVMPKNIRYDSLTDIEIIKVLHILLDSARYEVYTRKTGQIFIYDSIFQNFISENGFEDCNLEIFWKNVVLELHATHCTIG